MVENEWSMILDVCVFCHMQQRQRKVVPDSTVEGSHLRYLILGVHARPRLDQTLHRFDCKVSGIVSGTYVNDENVSRHDNMDEKSP